ncbi:3-oxoadipate CoA-transferase subunit A [Euzebya pacifica]|uniref:3-oxoadipate CoA-transferase subunit A n=1 Tax=Euzebya pacifica TaxID=1608957 RepID=A0A346XWR9_9ACTN|nr:CoA-transferase [Euzebya pacifica]AXV06666.1 3-oxoadipate CoA-transferase subunit A [Euzebya pacifica]
MRSPRAGKLLTVDQAAALVQEGDYLAIGGIWNHNVPMALVRALVRRGVGNLTLSSSPASGVGPDHLFAAGLVRKAYLPNVTFEHLGTAPHVRRAIEDERVTLVECDEASLIGGYRAAAAGLPFQPVVSLQGTALADGADWLIPVGRDGTVEALAAPPLSPDVAFLHAHEADQFGNVRHLASTFADRLIAKASRTVVVSVDRLVEHDDIRSAPARVTVPSYMVSHVVVSPFAAHPAATHGAYLADEDHLRTYLDAAKDHDAVGDGWRQYVSRYIDGGEREYLSAVGGLDQLASRLGVQP